MTGKHMGHCSVRDNPGGTPLRAGEATIASMLKGRGYATGGYGKWGAGGRGSTGVPEDMGSMIFSGTTTRFMLTRSIRRTWFTIAKKFHWLETMVAAVGKLTRTTKS